MDIREAVTISMKEGNYIFRESERESGVFINIIPTNTYDCCLLLQRDTDEVGKRWNPTANDLLATDWEVETKNLDREKVLVKVTILNIEELKKLLIDAENQYEQLEETLTKIEEFKIQSFVKHTPEQH